MVPRDTPYLGGVHYSVRRHCAWATLMQTTRRKPSNLTTSRGASFNCEPPVSDNADSEPYERESVVPPNKRKIPGQDGQLHDAVPVGFQNPSGEYWNEYVLDDGTLVRLKPVVAEVLRIEGKYDPEGNPLYAVKTQNVVVIDAPEKIRKRPQ